MTLIAAFKAFEVPIIFGDILISQTGDVKPHIKLPTLPDSTVEDLMPSEWMRTVTHLRRKVCIINKHFAVAWAGNLLGAKYVIKKMRSEFHDGLIDRKNLNQFFNNLETLGTETNCIVIGWIIEKSNMYSFKWESQSKYLMFSSDPYFSGSGKNDFFTKHVEHIKTIQNQRFKSKIGYAVREAIMIACEMIGSELLFGDNLLELYGGGFEFVYLEKGKFRQLNDIVFLFWTVTNFDSNTISFSLDPLILEYRYSNDYLLINSLRQSASYKSGNLSLNSEFYVIPPVYFEREEINFNLTRTNSSHPKYYANFFFLEISDKYHIRSSLVIDGKNDLMQLVRKNGVFEQIKLTEKFAPLIHEYFRSVVQNNIYNKDL